MTAPDMLLDETFDVLVAGGGVTGISAALAAARQGARTLLVEPRPFIGGNAATGLCIHTFLTKDGRHVVHGIPQEIVDRLTEAGGAVGHVRLPDGYVHSVTPVDADLFRMETTAMLAEAGVLILYNTALVGAESHGGVVRRVRAAAKGRLGFLQARVYVDATGDADLSHLAGAQCREGWTGSGAMQPVSMMLRAVGVDVQRACDALAERPPAYATKKGVAKPFPVYFHGTFARWNKVVRERGVYDHDNHQFWTNTVWPNQLNVNASRLAHVDGNDPLSVSKATVELTAQLRKLSQFLKDCVPGFEDASFIPNAFVGVRESRNIRGLYEINEEDIRAGRKFADTVGQACFPVDIHHPDGKSQEHIDIGGDGAYDLPYRSLVPVGFANLLAAGRCISVTEYAHGGTRNMAPCMTTGEAAGTAAAMSAASGTPCPELPVGRLQDRLRAANVYLGDEPRAVRAAAA